MSAAFFDVLPDVVRARAKPLLSNEHDYDTLIERLGEADVVLLGGATHGTHEFYWERIRITRRLIEEKGFTGVAVEADWPPARRINSYVKGRDGGISLDDAFAEFRRFPTWMWRNAETRSFVGWLRNFNDAQTARSKASVGFYGLDLYSMRESVHHVLTYLTALDAEAALRARRRYSCFDHHGDDPQDYGADVSLGVSPSCEHVAVRQLMDIQASRGELIEKALALESSLASTTQRGLMGRAVNEAFDEHALPDEPHADAADCFFDAERNASVVVRAEEYYRALFGSRARSWNLREAHMADTAHALIRHLRRRTVRPRLVIWAHNSHVGDASATSLAGLGEVSLGQILRERLGGRVWNVGFTTHRGFVTAAADWDRQPEEARLFAAPANSIEAVLHSSGVDRLLLTFRGDETTTNAFNTALVQRAIGVIYRPQLSGQASHCFDARASAQFDALIHIDETHALSPVSGPSTPRAIDLPETFPFTL